MSQRDRDFDESLRRALHAAADSINPAGDGLERIRARTAVALPVAWMMGSGRAGGWSVLSRLRVLTAWLQPAMAWLWSAAADAAERFRPGRPDGAHPRRYGWLRPAAAAATGKENKKIKIC